MNYESFFVTILTGGMTYLTYFLNGLTYNEILSLLESKKWYQDYIATTSLNFEKHVIVQTLQEVKYSMVSRIVHDID